MFLIGLQFLNCTPQKHITYFYPFLPLSSSLFLSLPLVFLRLHTNSILSIQHITRYDALHESKVRGCDHFLPNIELKNPDSASRGLPPVAATDCFVRVFLKQKLVQSCVFRLKSPEATQVASGSSKINL